MIKNPHLYDALCAALVRSGRDRLTHAQAMRIFEGLWEEARTLGVLPPGDPLEGIETDIRVARILNSCSKTFSDV